MNINELLPQVPIFSTLEPEEVSYLRPFIEKKVFRTGDTVFDEGDPGDGVYVVAIGAVKAVKQIDAKHTQTLAGFLEKDFFGELSLLDGRPRSARIVATRDSVLLKISVEKFQEFMQQAPFSALKIISQIACHLALRLRETNRRLAELENYRLLHSSDPGADL
ncbi:MAG: cyclic nucleotide-binding domain-containing protein [Candidatus Hydrogenedentota bacterium]|nr:MAG: cyclic nucleotide-binding domain-containing protein [Candidatus Hydrogenedentota bacterium]